MPTYDYLCVRCGAFQAERPMAEAQALQQCPECGRPAVRGLACPHLRTSPAASRYLAAARNERSANEPATEHRLAGTTEHHHAHGRPGAAGDGYTHAGSGHRPWMIGH